MDDCGLAAVPKCGRVSGNAPQHRLRGQGFSLTTLFYSKYYHIGATLLYSVADSDSEFIVDPALFGNFEKSVKASGPGTSYIPLTLRVVCRTVTRDLHATENL